MLVNLNDVLLPARRGRYAVGLFNAINLELARGVFAAAERNRSPVIVGTAEVLLPYGPLEELAWLLVPMARRASVPVVVHFDHGLTAERCLEALRLGFSSVMYDCSTDGFEENIRKTREMAEIAHAAGASIEAELGHVGDAEGSLEGAPESETAEALYTDPGEARDFVRRTGVDALAIAVGTAHGHYRAKPKLDFDRIARIAAAVPVPLVLHGGSGLSDDDFRTTIARGISKVNIFTDINAAAAVAAGKALDARAGAGLPALTDLVRPEVDAVEAAVSEKMRVFGSTGKA